MGKDVTDPLRSGRGIATKSFGKRLVGSDALVEKRFVVLDDRGYGNPGSHEQRHS